MKGLLQRELVATLRTRGSVINPLDFFVEHFTFRSG